MNPTSSILNDLRAEALLEGSHILEQITVLSKGLRYNTAGNEVSFNDFFETMQMETSDLPRLELEATVTPGAEAQYQIQLVTALELVFDRADHTLNRLLFFQSKLRAAMQSAKALEVTFVAWYSIAVSEALRNHKDIKLNATVIKALAESEFARLMAGVNIDVETLMEATKILAKQIQSHKTLAQEKYSLGKDQVNASWTSQNLPAEALADSDGASQLAVVSEPEEEDNSSIPVFVTKETRLAPPVEKLFVGEDAVAAEIQRVVEAAKSRIDIKNKKDRNGIFWPYCDMCHDPKCPWCYPADNAEIAGKVAEASIVEKEVQQDWKTFVVETTPLIPIEEVAPTAAMGELHLSADQLALMLGDDVKVTATNAEGNPIKFAPIVKEKKERKTKLAFELPAGDADQVIRGNELDTLPKVKCVVCDRRIRIGQMMFRRQDGWAHSVATDCTEVPEHLTPAPAVVPPSFISEGIEQTNAITDIIVNHLETMPVEERQEKVAAFSDVIKGTFVKRGDPAPVSIVEPSVSMIIPPADNVEPLVIPNAALPQLDTTTTMQDEIASSLLKQMENNSAAVRPARKKLEMLPEDENV